MVIETVLQAGVIVFTTINIGLWAFRPDNYSTDPRARRFTQITTAVWAILLPAWGAVALALGMGTWQGPATFGVTLACWPVTLLALRKRHISRAAQPQADRQAERNCSPSWTSGAGPKSATCWHAEKP